MAPARGSATADDALSKVGDAVAKIFIAASDHPAAGDGVHSACRPHASHADAHIIGEDIDSCVAGRLVRKDQDLRLRSSLELVGADERILVNASVMMQDS